MDTFAKYLASLPVQIETLKRQLKPLEEGTMRLGSKHLGAAEWVDETPKQIADLKDAIATHQKILEEYEKKGSS